MAKYRLDESELELFRLYRHALPTIAKNIAFNPAYSTHSNDDATLMLCNEMSDYWVEYGEVPHERIVHLLCGYKINLIATYAPQYEDDIRKIIELKHKLATAAKQSLIATAIRQAGIEDETIKAPVDADPTVGNIFFELETTTKS